MVIVVENDDIPALLMANYPLRGMPSIMSSGVKICIARDGAREATPNAVAPPGCARGEDDMRRIRFEASCADMGLEG
jgi:hypothetical protein